MLYTLENFNLFRDAAHNASRDAGWWNGTERYGFRWPNGARTVAEDDPGSCDPDRLTVPTKLCLIHSEISEAYEGYMTPVNDGHLPQYPSAAVEFGDVIIRIGDLAGYLNLDMTAAVWAVEQCDAVDVLLGANIQVCFNRLHLWTSAAMEGYRKNTKDGIILSMPAISVNLARVVILCDLLAQKNKWDLPAIVEAKMNYNATRADHKLEARAAEGGKQF